MRDKDLIVATDLSRTAVRRFVADPKGCKSRNKALLTAHTIALTTPPLDWVDFIACVIADGGMNHSHIKAMADSLGVLEKYARNSICMLLDLCEKLDSSKMKATFNGAVFVLQYKNLTFAIEHFSADEGRAFIYGAWLNYSSPIELIHAVKVLAG